MAKVVELSDYGDSNPRKPKKIEGTRKSANDTKPEQDKPRKSLKSKSGSKVKESSKKVSSSKKNAKLLPAKTTSSVDDLDSQFVDVLGSIPDSVKQENDQIQEYIRMFGKLGFCVVSAFARPFYFLWLSGIGITIITQLNDFGHKSSETKLGA
jgi:hypothetical protein